MLGTKSATFTGYVDGISRKMAKSGNEYGVLRLRLVGFAKVDDKWQEKTEFFEFTVFSKQLAQLDNIAEGQYCMVQASPMSKPREYQGVTFYDNSFSLSFVRNLRAPAPKDGDAAHANKAPSAASEPPFDDELPF